LHGFHRGSHSLLAEARTGNQQDHIGVVAREAAMFSELLCAAGVSHTDVRGGEDVRSARIAIGRESGSVEVGAKDRSGEDFSDSIGT
jgi:hypothetical protein